jgi:hypothetical protein
MTMMDYTLVFAVWDASGQRLSETAQVNKSATILRSGVGKAIVTTSDEKFPLAWVAVGSVHEGETVSILDALLSFRFTEM